MNRPPEYRKEYCMIHLRPATNADLLLMFKWRNHPEVYKGFYSQTSPLNWHEHLGWWATRPSSWITFIICDTKPVGLINIGQLDHWSPELGWLISYDNWGKGYTQEAIKLAFEYLKERGYQYCHTTIKRDNEASNHIAWKLGFSPLGQAREAETWLTKDLNQNCLI